MNSTDISALFPDLVQKAREQNALTSGMFAGTPDASQASLMDALNQTRLQAASLGIDPTAAQPRESLLWQAVDVLGKPSQWMYGLVEGVGSGKLFSEGIGKTLYDADTRNLSASDLLAQMGWRSSEDTWAPAALAINASRGVAGFVADVALDPLGLLGGITKGAKGLDAITSLAAGTNIGKTVKVAGKEVTKVGGRYIDDIQKILEKEITNPNIDPAQLAQKATGQAPSTYTDIAGKVIPGTVDSPFKQVVPQKTEDIAYSLFTNLDELRKLDVADPSYVLKSDIISSRLNALAADAGPHADDMLDLFNRATNQSDDIFNLRKNTESYMQVQVPFLGFITGKSDMSSTLDRWKNVDWGSLSLTQKTGYGTLAAASTIFDGLGYANVNLPLSSVQTLSKQAFNIASDIAVKVGVSEQNMDALVKQAIAATTTMSQQLPPSVLQAAQKIKNAGTSPDLTATYNEMVDIANTLPEGAPKDVQLALLKGKSMTTEEILKGGKPTAGLNASDPSTKTYQQMRQWLEEMSGADSILDPVNKGRATVALIGLDETYAANKLAYQVSDVSHMIQDKARAAKDNAKWVGGLFSHGLKYGKAEDINARYFANDRAASTAVAKSRIASEFGEWATLPEAQRFTITKNADIANDMAMMQVKATEEGAALFAELDSYEVMAKATTTGPTLQGLSASKGNALARIQELHSQALQQNIAAGLVDPEAASFLTKSAQLAAKVRQEEMAWGIATPSALGVYMPKRYLEYINDAAKTDNTAARKYNSFMEALTQSDKAPSYDAVASWQERLQASQGMIAQKRYAKRMALVHGLKPEHLIELQNAARLDPRGPEADLLYNIGEAIPVHLRNSAAQSAETGGEIGKTANYTNVFQRKLEEYGLTSSYAPSLATEAGIAQDDVLRNINEINSINNISPQVPIINDGEEGVLAQVSTQHGIKEMYLPKALQDAYSETDGTAKWLERAVPKGSIGDKYIKMFDNLRTAQKGPLVWMFAASHMTNAVSDRLMAFMRGGFEAANPLYSLDILEASSGRRGLKLPSGAVLKGEQFNQFMNQYGFGSNARIEEAFLEQSGRGSMEWLQGTGTYGAAQKMINSNSVTKGVADAYTKTKDWATNLGYDQLMRKQMFVHYIKNGAMPSEAARLANAALIDYRDMTSFEKSIAQRMMLFYGFLKGSTKMAILDLVSASPAVNRQIQASKMLSQIFSTGEYTGEQLEENAQRGLITSGIQESMGFVTGKTKEGLPEVTRVNISPLSAAVQTWQAKTPRSLTSFSEVLGAMTDSTRGTGLKLMSQSNPLIKNAYELLANKSSYYDMPLSSQFLRKLPDVTMAAERLSAYPFMSIPAAVIQSISEPIQQLLGAQPVGTDGRFVAVNPVSYAMISGVLPVIGRTVSVLNKSVDPNQGIGDALRSALTPLRPDSTDLEKIGSYRELNELKSQIESITGYGKSVKKQRDSTLQRQQTLNN